ncbi:hypothetical protein BCR44DRAFT_1483365 [Catenaria anguillulae PL171]|uniref:Cytochrome b5 heme-binding domain-containing protein n=1 Tax=Catenaria anguillulae PL171 TaxID=765915 RepID=A0A1Y2HVK3_9FUNG|nr:hypothetical protein BCR44DRAFT_1483365 [Catenaria anguillulae PL171]
MADSAYTYPPPAVPPQAKPQLFRRPEVAAHGSLMLILFGLVFPSMAVLARYARPHVRDWARIHGAIQTLAALLTVISALLVLNNDYACTKPHKQFGILILVLLGVQVAGGIAHYRTLVGPPAQVPHGVYRNGRVHATIGAVILILGVVQMPQGIHHGWRFMSADGWKSPWYVVYYILMCIWAIVVAVLEARRQVTQRRLRIKRDVDDHYLPLSLFAPSHHHALSTSTATAAQAVPDVSNVLAVTTAHAAASHARSLGLPEVTWAQVESAIEDDAKSWIVGPGGVVYDIRKWITAHPGGPQVLLDAIGCNVSLDYFNVETFDVHRFKPFPEPLSASSSPSTSASRPSSFHCQHIMSASTQIATRRVTQSDMSLVLAARRTHIHSPTAISKLAPMAAAIISDAGSVFDKHEYRRYALTEYTPAGSSMTRISFTLLYPNETYPEEPAYFLPGHCIQIRFRSWPPLATRAHIRRASASSNLTKYTSRYLTPISGNMTHLTCMLKLDPGDALSTLLASTYASPKQYQLRGPFGTPLINPSRPLPFSNGCWDHVLFLVAGMADAALAVQTLAYYFAQTYWPVACVDAHVPQGHGQVCVRVGERIMIRQVLANGWVWVTTSEGVGGMIPLRCIGAWIGPNPKVTVVVHEKDREAVGVTEMLESIATAYPSQVLVNYRLTCPPTAMEDPMAVRVSLGDMSQEFISSLLAATHHPHRQGSQSTVIMCGPAHVTAAWARWAIESSLVDSHSLIVVPHNTCLTHLPPPPTVVTPPTAAELNAIDDEDDLTCILPAFPASASSALAMRDDQEDEDVLWLPPALPARVDPVTGEMEWMYIPPSETMEQSREDAASSRVGQGDNANIGGARMGKA